MQIFRISDFILVFAMACCGPVRVCPVRDLCNQPRFIPGLCEACCRHFGVSDAWPVKSCWVSNRASLDITTSFVLTSRIALAAHSLRDA